MQLVFGMNVRIPHDLLSDDALDSVGLADMGEAAADADTHEDPAEAPRRLPALMRVH